MPSICFLRILAQKSKKLSLIVLKKNMAETQKHGLAKRPKLMLK
jgi:hypothetical protein